MPTDTEIRDRFWKELKSEQTIMLGLDGATGGGMKPMTALIEEDESGPLWIFTAKDTELAQALTGGAKPAHAAFTGKKHDLFANVSGSLALDNDRAVIDRLWNPFVAAWFEGGKDDPKLALLRFDPDNAKIWLNATPLGAAIEWLLRRDPKESYQDKVADVAL
ncbi:MAG TPA: pyridoxamine 5'-phosphate oxidase family protein [Allosphingosinicella sp.]|nr:pyridoxamine 5'-phosphate oxidase family protein [Allosphingosinicella sp.]